MKLGSLFVFVLIAATSLQSEANEAPWPFHCHALVTQQIIFKTPELKEGELGTSSSGVMVTEHEQHDTSLSLYEAISDAFDEIESGYLEDTCKFSKILKEKNISVIPEMMEWTLSAAEDEDNEIFTICAYACGDLDYPGALKKLIE